MYPAHYVQKLRMEKRKIAEMLRRDVGCDSDSIGPTGIGNDFETWKNFFQQYSQLFVFSALSAVENRADR